MLSSSWSDRRVVYHSPVDAWILDASPGGYRRGVIGDPVPLPDEVLVRPVASALNHMDLWATRGRPRPPLPHVPGCDVAGVVQAVGTEVATVCLGDEVVVNPGVSPVEDIATWGRDSPLGRGFRIIGEHRWGGHAGLVAVPAGNVRPRPRGRTWHECAAFPVAYVTALRALRRARLACEETLLVVGIGSGVSMAAATIAARRGARVVATSRDPGKRAAALRAGVDQVLDTEDSMWDVNADVVLESVGPATWEKSVAALRPGGRLVVVGGTSGSRVDLALPPLFWRQQEIIGSSMGSAEDFDEVCELLADGLPVEVDSVHTFAEYPSALARLDEGRHLGKIVIDHSDRED